MSHLLQAEFTHHHGIETSFFSLNLKIPVFKAQFEWQRWIRNTSRFLPMGLIPLGTRQRFLHLQSWTLTNFYRFIETLWKRGSVEENICNHCLLHQPDLPQEGRGLCHSASSTVTGECQGSLMGKFIMFKYQGEKWNSIS